MFLSQSARWNLPLLLFLVIGFASTSQSSDSSASDSLVKLRVTPSKEISSEVDASADALFLMIEKRVRKKYKVTFFNNRQRLIEAESRHHCLSVRIQSLPTGKSGVTVTAKLISDMTSDVEMAKKLALELFAPTQS